MCNTLLLIHNSLYLKIFQTNASLVISLKQIYKLFKHSLVIIIQYIEYARVYTSG